MTAEKNLWVSGNDAAEIISKNSGHEVSAAYVRLLSSQGKIKSRPKNKRENEYYLPDVAVCRVEGKGRNRPVNAGPTVRERRAQQKQDDRSVA